MARKKTETTTPSNKNTTAAKAKPPKASKSKTTQPATGEAEPETKPLQSTIGEVLVAKGAKPINEVQVVNFDRRLPCPLTTAEVIQRAQTIKELRSTVAHLDRRMTEEKEEFARIKGEFDQAKTSIESEASKIRSTIEDLTYEIAEQSVHRDVRCQRVFDYRLMQVKELRMDRTPPEPLQESRPMTAREAEQGYTNDDGKREGKSFEDVSQRDDTDHAEPEEDDGIIDDAMPMGDEVELD
jgi:hypothetical protein